MADDDPYIPFSQRHGYAEIPPQLKVGEVSDELRRLLGYAVDNEWLRMTKVGMSGRYYLDATRESIAKDFHVRLRQRTIAEYRPDSSRMRREFQSECSRAPIAILFNFVEFLARHRGITPELKEDLAQAFIDARAAYRLVDGFVIPVGTEEQAEAVIKGIEDAEKAGADGARQHLVQAGVELRHGEWAASVRESISAVEAMALKIEPKAKTLGDALSKIERSGRLHGSLKAAFGKLYGYTSDEEGIRHANVLQDKANVDEADALFMLGACAPFVSYLIARVPQD